MNKLILALILLIPISVVTSNAYEWKWNDPQVCSNCQIVHPYDSYTSWYHPHLLKVGEEPSYLPYECTGCDMNDYSKIFKQTGLWYYPYS